MPTQKSEVGSGRFAQDPGRGPASSLMVEMGMHEFASEQPLDVEILRARLRRMDDAALQWFGEAARCMCSPDPRKSAAADSRVADCARPSRNSTAQRPAYRPQTCRASLQKMRSMVKMIENIDNARQHLDHLCNLLHELAPDGAAREKDPTTAVFIEKRLVEMALDKVEAHVCAFEAVTDPWRFKDLQKREGLFVVSFSTRDRVVDGYGTTPLAALINAANAMRNS